MAVLTAYDQPLTADGSIPTPWRYALVLPGLANGGAACRVQFEAPASGSMTYAALYIGRKGVGAYDFDGTQVPLTVNGQTSFTITAGQRVWSDPVAVPLAAGQPAVVTYDGVGSAGKAYRYTSGLASGSFCYLSGLGGASNGDTTKSGYTVVSGTMASVRSIEVAGSVAELLANPAGGLALSGAEQVVAGQRMSSGADLPAGSGYPHFMLANPSTSGKRILLSQAIVNPATDCLVSLRRVDAVPAGAVLQPKCNVMFGAGQNAGLFYSYDAPSVLGSFHSLARLKGGVPYVVASDCPVVGLNPGWIVALAVHEPGISVAANFEWREV